MSLMYTDKGPGLHDAIRDAGYAMQERDGTWTAVPEEDEAAIQAIIDGYDPLPWFKKTRKRQVRKEAASRVGDVYAFVKIFLEVETDGSTDIELVNSIYLLVQDQYLSILAAARGTLQPRLEAFKNIRDRALLAIAEINAATDWQVVRDYDPVNDPIWP